MRNTTSDALANSIDREREAPTSGRTVPAQDSASYDGCRVDVSDPADGDGRQRNRVSESHRRSTDDAARSPVHTTPVVSSAMIRLLFSSEVEWTSSRIDLLE